MVMCSVRRRARQIGYEDLYGFAGNEGVAA